jgi:hypothetical protein
LHGRAGGQQYLLMTTTAGVLPLTVAAPSVRGEQQQGHARRLIPGSS